MNAPESAPNAFANALAKAWPRAQWADRRVVVAVSGGADSVALLRALISAGSEHTISAAPQLLVAHFDHRLRTDSADDASFVHELALRHTLPCFIGRASDEQLRGTGDGIEAMARHARYDFLASLAAEQGARYVATAHTHDDQIETTLMRILRGTGIAGLAGMSFARPLSEAVTLVRPLLGVSRVQVIEYLAALGQEYRDDPTNGDASFTRNRVRNELLPLLAREYNTDVRGALARLNQQAGEFAGFLTKQIEPLLSRAVTSCSDQKIEIDCSVLRGTTVCLVREVLRATWRRADWPEQAMGFDQWEAVAGLMCSEQPGSFTLPGNIQAELRTDKKKNDARLILSRRSG